MARKRRVLLPIKANDKLKDVKKNAVTAAKELGYLPNTINSIIRADTTEMIMGLLANARRSEIGMWMYKITY